MNFIFQKFRRLISYKVESKGSQNSSLKMIESLNRGPLSEDEHSSFVVRMNLGDYNFSDHEENLLIRAWHADCSQIPVPTKVKEIYDSLDAFAMNSQEVAEINFKLPYGIAYEEAQTDQYNLLIDSVLKNGVLLEQKIILDAGCGFGGLISILHKRFPNSKYFAIECVESARARLKKTYPWLKISIDNIQENLDNMNELLSEPVDVLFCTEVLERLKYPEQALKNFLDITKKNGTLILTVPDGRIDATPQHINFWSPESWRIFINKIVPEYNVKFLKTPSKNAPGGNNLCAIIYNR